MAELPKAAQGTFDELLAGVEPNLAAIARRLRAIIRAVDVSTVETVRLGDNAATYGIGPKKMTDGYAYIMPMRGYINLGFYQGGAGGSRTAAGRHRQGAAPRKNPFPGRGQPPPSSSVGGNGTRPATEWCLMTAAVGGCHEAPLWCAKMPPQWAAT
jgi:hypothetical protein